MKKKSSDGSVVGAPTLYAFIISMNRLSEVRPINRFVDEDNPKQTVWRCDKYGTKGKPFPEMTREEVKQALRNTARGDIDYDHGLLVFDKKSQAKTAHLAIGSYRKYLSNKILKQ